jgi:hypothetical protein
VKLDNPYKGVGNGGQWYKGSLHVHTEHEEMYPGATYNEWDKPRKPAEVMDDYAAAGYDFFVLSEQNSYPTQADLTTLNRHNKLLVIPGAEIDGRRIKTGQHLGHVNPTLDDPIHHVTDGESLDLAEVVRRAKNDPKNPLVTQVHPQFPREPDGREMDILHSRGIDAIEIVNSWWMQRPFAFEDAGGKYSPFAFHLWDSLLKEGGRTWGVPGCCSVQPRDVGRSWVNVWVKDSQLPLTADAVVAAIRAGQFYVSTVSTPIDPSRPLGMTNPTNVPLTPSGSPKTKNDPGVAIDKIEIETDAMGEPTGVTIETDATHVYAIVDGGPRLTLKGSGGIFTTPFTFPDRQRFGKNSKYIRFECVAGPSADNWDESYDWDNTQKINRSWTQPIWVTP